MSSVSNLPKEAAFAGAPVALRILHLPDVVGGHSVALARAERTLGHHSESLGYRESPYGYRPDRALRWGAGPKYRRWLERIGAFLDVRSRYDVFHFNFGASLLHSPAHRLILPELAYYSDRAKRFMTFQGSESRLAYPPALAASIEEEVARGRLSRDDLPADYPGEKQLSKRRRVVERSASLCEHIFVLNPDLLTYLPQGRASHLPYAISLPEDFSHSDTTERERQGRPPHFVHLSTNPLLKGTGLIERALAIASERCTMTYDIVVRRPRPEALQRLARADYHVDQMVLGWYGGTAVEAMLMGIPVVCHIDEAALAAAEPGLASDLPIIGVSAEALADQIVRLAHDRDMRTDLARQSREFANRWHHPENVAARTLRRYSS